MKKLCIYCSASDRIDSTYHLIAKDLGKLMAKNNFELVFGGGMTGLMGTLSETILAEGGKAYGYITNLLVDIEGYSEALTEIHIVESMHIRKEKMAESADAFVILPGGFGTLDEFFEILTWKQLNIHQKPILILNAQDYWKPLEDLMQHMVDQSFAKQEHQKCVKFFKTPHELIMHLKNDIEIYTTSHCPYCVKAKKLLDQKGVTYQEIDVSDDALRLAMVEKAGGRRTVPQIFIHGYHVGGCDDLYALEEKGELDKILEDIR